ncbi:MAG: substrate-binding domain-containing protein [Verrucomicrobiaceae bacterium]|nr:substrate-binding domain-containing protein [Verrucomicrobiaceae bacterium]
MKTLILALFTFSLAMLFCGCGGSSKSSSGKYRIAVVPKASNHMFWKTIHAGTIKAAQEEDVEILWKGPLIESDREGQIKVVENFVTQQVDALALAPLDDQAMIRPVKEASQDGIKVVIWDSGLDQSAEPFFDSFVATDNFAAGEKCGKKLAELLGGEGNVVLLRHMVGSASTRKREEGFLKGLNEAGPNIALISDDKYGGATMEEALEVSNNLLNRFGSAADGIFTPNESTTEAMMNALETAGLAGKVKFVGFDNNDTLVSGIESKVIDALALQDPFNMGYLAVKHAVAHLKGETVDKVVDTGSLILTLDNLQDARSQELVSPDVDKWLKE